MVRLQIIAEELKELISPNARKNLLAKGLARGFIWKNGKLPEDAPAYGPHLTGDLLDYGYSILVKAIRLYENDTELVTACQAMCFAAECLESAVRRGERNESRGFNLVVAAVAFHLSGFAARSFCLLEEHRDSLNLSTVERFLVMLLRKELISMREECFHWLNIPANQDAGLADSIREVGPEDEIDPMDLLIIALTRNFIIALARFEYALYFGDSKEFESAKDILNQGLSVADEIAHVPQWWCHKLTLLLFEDLWEKSLHKLLPVIPNDDIWNNFRRKYTAVQCSRDLSEVILWPSQLNAVSRVYDFTDDLVVALPTSAGKTKIAELCILRALSRGSRAIYVTPLRALSAQIEKRLARSFRPLGFTVSSLYGASGVTLADVDTLREDSVVVATPEKLDFAIRQDPSLLDDVGIIVLDEGHMIGLGTREIRYEVLVQRLLKREDSGQRRIVCLSAIFSSGDAFDDFTAWLRSGAEGTPVQSDWRPTRQRLATLPWAGNRKGWLIFSKATDFDEAFIPRFLKPSPPPPGSTRLNGARRKSQQCPADASELTLKTAERLVIEGHSVLIYCPQKRSVESLAKVAVDLHHQGLLRNLLKEEIDLTLAIDIATEWLGPEHVALHCLKQGIGLHHGSLPRPFLSEVEKLIDQKRLPIVVASPTMAQGVDLTCSALVFHSVYQFRDGENQIIRGSEYANVIGRVGRAFVDLDGLVVFPLFQPSKGRVNDIKRLVRSVNEREMESGIVQIITFLLSRIKAVLKLDNDQFLEYILNHSTPWTSTSDENVFDNLSSLLDSLDNAIFGTVEDLNAEINVLANLLDTALQGSLWQRRLAKLPENEIKEQQAFLQVRSKWLWTHSNPQQRKGFFSAGLGHQAGSHIWGELDRLLDLLLAADNALSRGDVEHFVESVQSIAAFLFDVYPYTRRDRDNRWGIALQVWLSGNSLYELGTDSNLLDCIQEDFVFRLVWGVEAIRVCAREAGKKEIENLSGCVPLALTYGVPSISAAILMQCGLSSRRVAQRILEEYPANFTRRADVGPWLNGIDSHPFLPESSDERCWKEFRTVFERHAAFSKKAKIFKIQLDTQEQAVSLVSDSNKTVITSINLEPYRKINIDLRKLAVEKIENRENCIFLHTLPL